MKVLHNIKLVKILAKTTGILALMLGASIQAKAFQVSHLGNIASASSSPNNPRLVSDYGIPALNTCAKTLRTAGRMLSNCVCAHPYLATFLWVIPLTSFLINKYNSEKKCSCLESCCRKLLMNSEHRQHPAYKALYSLLGNLNARPWTDSSSNPLMFQKSNQGKFDAGFYFSKPKLLRIMITNSIELVQYMTDHGITTPYKESTDAQLVPNLNLLQNLSVWKERRSMDTQTEKLLFSDLKSSDSQSELLAKIITGSLNLPFGLSSKVSEAISHTLPTILSLTKIANRLGLLKNKSYAEKLILNTITKVSSDMVEKSFKEAEPNALDLISLSHQSL